MKSFEAEIETELRTLEDMATLQEKEESLHESIGEFYEQPLPDYLINDPELVGYPDAEFQQMIYSKVVAELIGCNDVIDLGCGRCDLYPIVDAFGIGYVGVDRLVSMQKVAETKYPRVNFLCQDWNDPINPADAVVIVGSINSATSMAEARSLYIECIHIALITTIKKIVFVLSSESDESSGIVGYPVSDAIHYIPPDLPYKVDASFASGVYILTIWKNSFV